MAAVVWYFFYPLVVVAVNKGHALFVVLLLWEDFVGVFVWCVELCWLFDLVV